MIEVLQAAKAGKKIQCKGIGTEWLNEPNPDWNFSRWTYRIKPEPRVIYVNEYPNSFGAIHHTEEAAKREASSNCTKQVKFIEVIE